MVVGLDDVSLFSSKQPDWFKKLMKLFFGKIMIITGLDLSVALMIMGYIQYSTILYNGQSS